MATGAELLKELFVSIGWRDDEASRKKVIIAEKKTTAEIEAESKKREIFAKKARESLQYTAKEFIKLSAVAEAAALGVVAAVERMAKGFEAAYYSASRTGSSVKELNAFSYAASQVGSSAEEAQAAVEALSTAQRNMPGYASMLKGLGASDPKNVVKSLTEIMPRLAAMPMVQAEAYSKVLGIPEHLLLAMHDHLEEFKKFQAESNAKYGVLSFDPEKAASDGKALTQLFRTLYDTIQKLTELIGSKLFKDLKGPIADLNQFLLDHGKEIADAITAIAKALFELISGFVKELPRLNNFVQNIGGWKVALEALVGVFTALFVSRLASVFESLAGISRLAAPAWLLRFLGVGGVAGIAAGAAVGALRALPEDQKDQILDRHEALQELRKHRYGGAWNTIKQAVGVDRPTANDQLWLRSREGQKALRSSRRSWNEGSVGGGFSQKAPTVAKHLKADFGLTDEEAAAVLGNLGHESAGFTAFEEDKGRGPGRGWAQWTERGRKARFFAYAAGQLDPSQPNKLDPRSDEANYGFLKWELDHTHKNAIAALKAARGLDNKTVAFEGEFEGARVKAYGSRLKYAHTALAAMEKARSASAKSVVIPTMPASPFGNFDPAKLRATMSAPPLGGSPVNNSRKVDLHQTNHVSVTGVADPVAAAAMIGARHDKHSSTLVRNMQSAIA